VVHLEEDQSVLENGARVSAETSQRIACDASRVVVCDTARTAVSSRLAPGLGRSPRRYAGHSITETGVPLPGCGVRFARAITSVTGSRWAHYALESPLCSAAVTIAPQLRRDTSSIDSRMASFGSAVLTVRSYPSFASSEVRGDPVAILRARNERTASIYTPGPRCRLAWGAPGRRLGHKASCIR